MGRDRAYPCTDFGDFRTTETLETERYKRLFAHPFRDLFHCTLGQAGEHFYLSLVRFLGLLPRIIKDRLQQMRNRMYTGAISTHIGDLLLFLGA